MNHYANLDKIKKACGGYPDFWHAAIVASDLAREVATSFGGSADLNITKSGRKPIPNLHGRPSSMPFLEKDEKVVGVYNQGLGEKEMVCNSLEEMQKLYDSYASGMALTLKWFVISSSSISISV